VSLKVIPIGTEVQIRKTEIVALVVGISITPGPSIKYECSWMHEGELQGGWFYDMELAAKGKREQIGFRRVKP
jgi:hypothetical protein